jgi:hypothetical protein
MNNLEKSFADYKKSKGTVTLSPKDAYKAGFERAVAWIQDNPYWDLSECTEEISKWATTHHEPLKGTSG